MTKDQEIKKLEEIAAALPDSYLKDALTAFVPGFAHNIRSDIDGVFMAQDFWSLQREVSDAQAKLITLEKRQREAEKAKEKAERETAEIMGKLSEVKLAIGEIQVNY